MYMDTDERQEVAILTGATLLFVLPAAIIGLSYLIFGWAVAAGDKHAHAQILGWLSTAHHDKHGVYWEPAGWLWMWPLGVVSLYIIYQFCELLNWGFQSFKEALT